MFSKQFCETTIQQQVSQCLLTSTADVIHCLNKPTHSPSDLITLLSPAAENYIEQLAQKSQRITRQRFGNTIQLFIPMYLSNECFNTCTYCGFSMDNKYPRKTLTDAEIITEAKTLAKKGFQHILLLTGESPKKVGTDYIKHAITLIKSQFSSIGIEVQPMNQQDYQQLITAGADSLTLYQETYHKQTYKKHHLFGLKRNYANRLNAVEAGAKAGFYRISIGTLLGLYDWRFEALALANHLNYLMQHYWQVKYSVSFPRITDMYADYTIDYPTTTKQLVQLITAFRCIYPDLGINLSTRESATTRDNLIPLGVTTMSAESNTAPGGYTTQTAEEQFSTSDKRNVDTIIQSINTHNMDAVFKDWDYAFR